MTGREFVAVDAGAMPWEERFREQIGRPFYAKSLFKDAETGVGVSLIRYPRWPHQPEPHPPVRSRNVVLEERLVTHKGAFGPGTFAWFPEGEVMLHGASADSDVVLVVVTNKAFRIDYVATPATDTPP